MAQLAERSLATAKFPHFEHNHLQINLSVAKKIDRKRGLDMPVSFFKSSPVYQENVFPSFKMTFEKIINLE